jgi:predicted TIM-barrel fold metal-dependent hydrolase
MRALVCLTAALLLPPSAHAQPVADHHQHLFSPAIAALISPPAPAAPVAPITATDLIAHLDRAGIKRAAVMSTAYIFGQPSRNVANQYEKVRADNDWTSEQVAQFPARLIGFCGINPLEDYAFAELARCAEDPSLRHGVKLHFGNSAVDYRNTGHVAQLRRVFAAANDHGMAIAIHMRASVTQKLPYGAEEARVFLNEVLPAAPDVPVQIAHLAGAGGYPDSFEDDALTVFVAAIAKRDPRTTRLWFDVTTVAVPGGSEEQLQHVATRIRQLGIQRILYGSDAPTPNNLPRDGWALFRRLPLTEDEFATIANNVAPYMR